MPSLTLKDIPLDLLKRLRAAAARERRSLVQEVLVLIEGGLAERETAEERAERQVEAWRGLAGRDAPLRFGLEHQRRFAADDHHVRRAAGE